MENFKEIISWPSNIEINIDQYSVKILHQTYGPFSFNYEFSKDHYNLKFDESINCSHLFRICKIQEYDHYDINNLFDLFNCISGKISEPFKYCTICGNYNSHLINEPSYCSLECKNKIYELWTNNIVSNTYKNDNLMFIF